MHYGIDISSNNAHPIDYGAVVAYLRRLGVDQPFVIVKITQGTGYVNPYFAQDVAGFRSAGAAVAGYLMDEGNQDPAAEVTMYRRLVGNLPLTFDIELPDGNANYAAHARDLVAQDGAGLAYLNQSEMQEGFPTGAGLWLAEYNNRPTEVAYPCLLHQYSNAGAVPGMSGQVDLNVWLGTEAQFQLFFLPTSHTDALSPPQPPPEEDMKPYLVKHSTGTIFAVAADCQSKVGIPEAADAEALLGTGQFLSLSLTDQFLGLIPTAS